MLCKLLERLPIAGLQKLLNAKDYVYEVSTSNESKTSEFRSQLTASTVTMRRKTASSDSAGTRTTRPSSQR